MTLLVGHYLDASPERLGEFLTCIERNAANPHIGGVHVFIENALAPTTILARYPQLAGFWIALRSHAHDRGLGKTGPVAFGRTSSSMGCLEIVRP